MSQLRLPIVFATKSSNPIIDLTSDSETIDLTRDDQLCVSHCLEVNDNRRSVISSPSPFQPRRVVTPTTICCDSDDSTITIELSHSPLGAWDSDEDDATIVGNQSPAQSWSRPSTPVYNNDVTSPSCGYQEIYPDYDSDDSRDLRDMMSPSWQPIVDSAATPNYDGGDEEELTPVGQFGDLLSPYVRRKPQFARMSTAKRPRVY